MGVTVNAPHQQLTYRIIGLAMEVHNELGPGHREADYHDALCIKFKNAGLNFLDEPEILITLDSGEMVKARRPDFVVEDCVIVELKGRTHLMTKDDQAQVIGYFAALKQCPIEVISKLANGRKNRLFLKSKS